MTIIINDIFYHMAMTESVKVMVALVAQDHPLTTGIVSDINTLLDKLAVTLDKVEEAKAKEFQDLVDALKDPRIPLQVQQIVLSKLKYK